MRVALQIAAEQPHPLRSRPRSAGSEFPATALAEDPRRRDQPAASARAELMAGAERKATTSPAASTISRPSIFSQQFPPPRYETGSCDGGSRPASRARACRVRLPGARRHEAELQGAGQPDRAQHVRQHVVIVPARRFRPLRIFDQVFPQSGQRHSPLAAVHSARIATHHSSSEDTTMQAGTDKLVILVTKGIEFGAFLRRLHHRQWRPDRRPAGLDVPDQRRGRSRPPRRPAPDARRAARAARRSIADFQKRGGVIWACPPCVKARGYEQADLLDGVIIVGASAMHAEIKEGRPRCRSESGEVAGAFSRAAAGGAAGSPSPLAGEGGLRRPPKAGAGLLAASPSWVTAPPDSQEQRNVGTS